MKECCCKISTHLSSLLVAKGEFVKWIKCLLWSVWILLFQVCWRIIDCIVQLGSFRMLHNILQNKILKLRESRLQYEQSDLTRNCSRISWLLRNPENFFLWQMAKCLVWLTVMISNLSLEFTGRKWLVGASVMACFMKFLFGSGDMRLRQSTVGENWV